jgi:hypothetical protein
MIMRLAVAGLAAVPLLVIAIFTRPTVAKPPDLPARKPVTCDGQPCPESDGGVRLRLAVESDQGICPSIEVQSPPAEPPYSCARCLLETGTNLLAARFLSPWTLLGVEISGEVTVTPADDSAPPQESTPAEEPVQPQAKACPGAPGCPRTEPPCEKCPVSWDTAGPPSVLDNLQRLAKARELCREAERHNRQNRPEAACACYQKVHQLVPGSRYDRKATAQLARLLPDERPPAEEQEAGATDGSGSPACWKADAARCSFGLRIAAVRATANLHGDGHGEVSLGIEIPFGLELASLLGPPASKP